MFPPPPLISKTLTKIEDNGITVPRWTATPWWDRLTHMAIDVLTTLGLSRNVCRAKIGASQPGWTRLLRRCRAQGVLAASASDTRNLGWTFGGTLR